MRDFKENQRPSGNTNSNAKARSDQRTDQKQNQRPHSAGPRPITQQDRSKGQQPSTTSSGVRKNQQQSNRPAASPFNNPFAALLNQGNTKK